MTKLAAKLPAGDLNGLAGHDKFFAQYPHDTYVIVGTVNIAKLTEDVDTGVTEPTLRIRAIEILDGDDQDTAQRLLAAAIERRTGQIPLSQDDEDDE